MSSNTMSFALPKSLRSYVDERVRAGQYGNTSEHTAAARVTHKSTI